MKIISRINKKSDFDNLDKNKNYYLTNQTTLSILDIKEFIDYAKDILPNLEVENSICNSTYERQKALLDLENNLFINLGLCWVFVAVLGFVRLRRVGASLVVVG